MRSATVLVAALVCASGLACGKPQPTASSPAQPTPADAKTFLDNANATTLKLGIEQSQAGWVQQTYITDDTEAIAARANQAANEAGARFARESTRYRPRGSAGG